MFKYPWTAWPHYFSTNYKISMLSPTRTKWKKPKKTKVIHFNVSKNHNVLPQINFPGHESLEVIYIIWLLGITLSCDLSWILQILLRVRSTLEFAALVFNCGLSQVLSLKLELVQKKAFAIALGSEYVSYENAPLTILDQDRLDVYFDSHDKRKFKK